jgi:hypothetical protein
MGAKRINILFNNRGDFICCLARLLIFNFQIIPKKIKDVCDLFHTETVHGDYEDLQGNKLVRVFFDDIPINELQVMITKLKEIE